MLEVITTHIPKHTVGKSGIKAGNIYRLEGTYECYLAVENSTTESDIFLVDLNTFKLYILTDVEIQARFIELKAKLEIFEE